MPEASSESAEPSALKRLALELDAGNFGAGTLAIGWATVDLERTAAELPDIEFDFAPDDEALGARALIGHAGGVDLVLLEPATEGRLAALLARRGEGIAAVYRQHRGLPQPGTARMTPLGRTGRLADPSRRSGPFLILMDG